MTPKQLGISLPFKGKNGKWYFNIKGENGEIVLPSQGYSTKSNAQRARKLVYSGTMYLEK